MKQMNLSGKELLITAGFFILLCFIFPFFPGHESDNHYWRNWATHIRENGLRNAYLSGTNYLPFYQYILWIFGKIAGNNISEHLVYLRCFTLLFDFIGLWYVYKWTEGRLPFLAILFISILNVAYSYNTMIWGQVDGIMATLVFVSLYYGYKKRIIVSSIIFLLALNMKLQAIVFLPLWGILTLQHVLISGKWKQLLYVFISVVLVQTLILFPFFKNDNTLPLVWNVITTSVDQYPKVSMNAFNFWHLVSPSEPWDTNDKNILIAGFSYKTVGLLLFFGSSLIALIPLLCLLIKNLRGQETAISREQVWITAAIISISFFYFNTQMHERYCHPAFIFLAALAFYKKTWIPYLLFTAAYFLNMEGVLLAFENESYHSVIFSPEFIACVFLLALITLYRLLYYRKDIETHTLS